MRSTDEPDEPKEVPMEIPIDDNPNEFFRDQTSPEKDLQFECPDFSDENLLSKSKILKELFQGFQGDSVESKEFRKIFSDTSKGNFHKYLSEFQKEDTAISHIRKCLNNESTWPENYENIRN